MNSNKHIFSSAVVAILVCVLFFLIINSRTSPAKMVDQQYDKLEIIKDTKTIRAAYAVGAPLFIMDPNSKEKSGIFYEIINSVADRLKFKVNWIEEVGYGEMIQGLKDDRYDIIGSGVWINSDRALGADFTIPLYYDAVFAYSREDDNRFNKDLSIINSPDYTIATMDGELGVTIADNDFPNADKLEIPQYADFTQMIENVIAKKADIVFLASAPARSYQVANPGRIKSIMPDSPLRIFPNAIMIQKGEYNFRQVLNVALMEMLNSGDIESILSKYEKVPNSFLRVAVPFKK